VNEINVESNTAKIQAVVFWAGNKSHGGDRLNWYGILQFES